ncbi:hypothetical protein SH528x_004956 [Novipirellula sp. SH528]|uniref:hypothetical protein n=1 Tax=Novipirellula sp. SH528 TaxID=3454466 RepID=UPI003FA09A9D
MKKPLLTFELYAPPSNEPEVIAQGPDEALVESTIREQSWNDLTFVVLRVDTDNWFEVSGSLNPADGLSAAYSEDGTEHVSDRPPESLDACISLMLSYLRADDRWRTDIDWQ